MEPRGSAALAPGVPSDYYEAIARVEDRHWWHRGMREITRVLLGEVLGSTGRALDAGCGTGGFLRFLGREGRFSSLAGTDIASAAIALARGEVPAADLHVAPLDELPFDDRSFALVTTNDVLQHVPRGRVEPSLAELHRVLAPRGTLLVRTNGSRRLRVERDDWRAYDASTLRRELVGAGFDVTRTTYVNTAPSVFAALRGRSPHAPNDAAHGVPGHPGSVQSAVGTAALALEARWLARGGSLPYGHTQFAVAVRR